MKSFVQQQLLICLLGVVIACTRGSSLPGSCIAAGHSSCCTTVNGGSSCHGRPPTCFCDPSCHEFQDCCADLDEICELELSPSEILSSVKPVFLFATYTTFHSATLQWATSSPNHTVPGVNVAYIIKYHQLSSASNGSSEMKAIAVPMENTTEYYMGDGLYGVVLSQLTPNTTYSSKVEVSIAGVPMSLGTNTVSFKTLEHPSVQELRIKLHNSTTIKLSWDPLELPLGVQLSHYTLYYSFDEFEMSHQFGVHDTCGMIGGLHVHREYQFSISATVVDVDGSVSESVRSTFIPIFVPDAVLFQLRGRHPHSCSSWNADTEQQLISAFQIESAQAIRTHCRCPYPDTYIKDPLLLCQDDESSSFTTFRATTLSTVNMTTQILLSYLTEWTSQEPVISSGTEDGGSVKLESKCSTRLRLRSDPLCSPSGCVVGENANSQQSLRNSSTAETCISIPIFVAAVAAELLFLLAVMLIGIIITVLKFSSRSKSATEEDLFEMSSTQRQAVQNTYEVSHTVTTPTTPEIEQPIATTLDIPSISVAMSTSHTSSDDSSAASTSQESPVSP